MSATYFWKGGQLLVVDRRMTTTDAVESGLLHLPCVDTNHEGPGMRYGKFTASGGWDHMPADHLPAKFRTTLLLMGVNP